MPETPTSLTLQLLTWIARQPRTYTETMEVWRSTCPRLTVWEDALADGLVRVRDRRESQEALVELTSRGQETLNQCDESLEASRDHADG
jgi:hypothetical protein